MNQIIKAASNTLTTVSHGERVAIRLTPYTPFTTASIYFEFDQLLSGRGSDFQIYANKGYRAHANDTALLQSIANALLTERSGVKWISVTAFQLELSVTSLVDADVVARSIVGAAEEAGYIVDYTKSSSRA